MSFFQNGVRNIGPSTNVTPNGTTWTLYTRPVTGNHSSGVEVVNQDSTATLWLCSIQRGLSAPANPPVVTQVSFFVSPLATLIYGVGDPVDIYYANSSGSATTTNAKITPVAY